MLYKLTYLICNITKRNVDFNVNNQCCCYYCDPDHIFETMYWQENRLICVCVERIQFLKRFTRCAIMDRPSWRESQINFQIPEAGLSGIQLGLASSCLFKTILVAVLQPGPALLIELVWVSHRHAQLVDILARRREVRQFSCCKTAGPLKVPDRN